MMHSPLKKASSAPHPHPNGCNPSSPLLGKELPGDRDGNNNNGNNGNESRIPPPLPLPAWKGRPFDRKCIAKMHVRGFKNNVPFSGEEHQDDFWTPGTPNSKGRLDPRVATEYTTDGADERRVRMIQLMLHAIDNQFTPSHPGLPVPPSLSSACTRPIRRAEVA